MTDKQTQLAWLDKQRSIVNDMIVNLPPDEQRKLLPELQVISAIAERVNEMTAVEYLEAREKMPMMEATKAIFAVGKDNRRAVEIVKRWKEEHNSD